MAPEAQRPPVDELIAFAGDLAGESGELIRGYFGRQLDVQRKADATPVTAADREAEGLLRRRIEARYPEHQVLGEEGGLSGPPEAVHQWVLDPIDGTKSFIHGVPLFGTLIALLEGGRPVLGVIHLPVSGELCIGAEGCPTTVNARPVRVSPVRELAEATLVYTDSLRLRRLGLDARFAALADRVRLVRGWGDCYGHFLVAAGRAEIMYDPELNLWDVAALKPCVEGAGGRLTDREGREGLGESALSTNGHLHDAALALLTGRDTA